MPAAIAQLTVLLAAPPGDADPTGGHGPEWGKAAPIGLLVWLFLGLALFLLIKSMNRNLRKVPRSFDSDDGDAAADGSASAAGAEGAEGSVTDDGEDTGDGDSGDARAGDDPPGEPAHSSDRGDGGDGVAADGVAADQVHPGARG